MPRVAASDMSLRCLPMSHKKYARLKWADSKTFLFISSVMVFDETHAQ